jgi:single-stranded-DNA-specific exonuclease
MRTWIEPVDIFITPEILEAARQQPLVARRLAKCGFSSKAEAEAFLDPFACPPTPPGELPGMELAASRLEQAIAKGEKICVWGDFDVDGQTSTALLVSTLKELGGDAFHHIPVRANESHGVNLPHLKKVVRGGAQVVLTCDTGITAHEAAAYAKNSGIDFIVTDHHDLPPTLPDAAAIVNPKLLPDSHPLFSLPGVGVSYKLAEELYTRAGSPRECLQHLDLVALGTVADLALLQGETRRLLQLGLDHLRRTNRLGIQLMLEMAEVEQSYLTEEHIGFVLGPRLNALGRLDDANPVVEFLTTEDIGRARFFASHMEALNARRKLLTDQVFQAARSQIESDPSLLEGAVLVLAHPTWPSGVIGIVASRLVERYQKPVLLLSSPPGEAARGSARSVAGVNITAALSAHADLLEGFGGHPMAAGLSILPQRISDLRRLLSRTADEMQAGTGPLNGLTVDAYLSLSEANLELAENLSRLAPFGPGNPPFTLACRDLVIKKSASLGRSGEHLQITVEDPEGTAHRVVWWQGAGWDLPEGRFDLAFNLRASSFSGRREAQLEWIDARPYHSPIIEIQAPPRICIHDHRGKPQPLALLKSVLKEGDALVWREGAASGSLSEIGIPGGDRRSLSPCRRLIIWTSPPGPEELQAAIQITKPDEVILFAIDPETGTLQSFLTRLAGLVKYTLKEKGGDAVAADLAAAAAHREAAIRLGLAYLAELGHIIIRESIPGKFLVEAANETPNPSQESLPALKELLKETAAYRSYYSRANPDILLKYQ